MRKEMGDFQNIRRISDGAARSGFSKRGSNLESPEQLQGEG